MNTLGLLPKDVTSYLIRLGTDRPLLKTHKINPEIQDECDAYRELVSRQPDYPVWDHNPPTYRQWTPIRQHVIRHCLRLHWHKGPHYDGKSYADKRTSGAV